MSKVLADGCFDPLHIGHIRYLMAAESFVGSISHFMDDSGLVVRVAPDVALKSKGRIPFQSWGERRATVDALRCVTRVVSHETLADAVKVERPRYLVKGSDWAGRLPSDVVEACRSVGTLVVYVDTQERTSTERLAG